ncbi:MULTISPECIES: hypothetical protein [unclassified Micromonospora]|uniref:hypothetical protein n=1 Tax=unclassified Micromonospora TaxID=2617518 RepID=UPI000EF48664|nr:MULTISPECIES: hypothetical protein [unclassified Micromonospora]RLP93117.1 hypothetical protein EAD89_07055 [Micromonospora sp. BL4]RLP99032.1 hypothetical protein EAD98_03130 [Micromonospora sp. CV4]
MPRWGFAAATTSLLTAVALGVSGCGAAEVASQPAREAAVEVAAAMGVEGQALAAMGFDANDLDVLTVAAPATPAPGASPTAQDKAREKRGEEWRKRRQARVLLRRNTLHGEAVVKTKDGGTKTVAVQRGEVTAIDGDSMTVKSTDGFTMTWTFGDDLRVVERRATVQASDVKVGTTLGVAGAKDGDKGTARLILIPRAK